MPHAQVTWCTTWCIQWWPSRSPWQRFEFANWCWEAWCPVRMFMSRVWIDHFEFPFCWLDFVLACLSVTHLGRKVWNQHIIWKWRNKNQWSSAAISRWPALWLSNLQSSRCCHRATCCNGESHIINVKSPLSWVPSRHTSDPPIFRQQSDIICKFPVSNICATINWIHYIPAVVLCGCDTHAKCHAMVRSNWNILYVGFFFSPSCWSRTLFQMLAKTARAQQPSDFRPIANTRMLYKTFAFMI